MVCRCVCSCGHMIELGGCGVHVSIQMVRCCRLPQQVFHPRYVLRRCVFFVRFAFVEVRTNCAITPLWSLPMWIMSFCFSVSAAMNLLRVYQNVVQLFLCTFRCHVSSFFQAFFLYIVLSAAKFRIIIHCFIQSPLLFPSLSVCGPTLTRSTPYPGSNLALKHHPTICKFFF